MLLMSFLLCVCLYGSALGFVLEIRDISTDDAAYLLDLLDSDDDNLELNGGLCSKDETNKAKCLCSRNACQCCKRVDIFRAKPEPVCVSMSFNFDEKRYDVAVNLNGEAIFQGPIKQMGERDIHKTIVAKIPNKEDARLVLNIECQKMAGEDLKGCMRLSGFYDKDNDKIKDKVNTKFGCFKMGLGDPTWNIEAVF